MYCSSALPPPLPDHIPGCICRNHMPGLDKGVLTRTAPSFELQCYARLAWSARKGNITCCVLSTSHSSTLLQSSNSALLTRKHAAGARRPA